MQLLAHAAFVVQITNRKLKFGSAIIGLVVLGMALPVVSGANEQLPRLAQPCPAAC